jgi:hypothetical protein
MNLDPFALYTLPVERPDWDELLVDWQSLIPSGASRYLLSRFGELFFEQTDGEIGMLQVSEFQYEIVAFSKAEFEKWLGDPDKMRGWFLAPLVDQLVAAGSSLKPDYCYSFKQALGLGGSLDAENVMEVPIREHFGLWGEVYRQIKDTPPGSEVVLEFKDPS